MQRQFRGSLWRILTIRSVSGVSLAAWLSIYCLRWCAAVLMVSWVVVASGVLCYAYLTVDDLELATCNSLKLLQLQREGDGDTEL